MPRIETKLDIFGRTDFDVKSNDEHHAKTFMCSYRQRTKVSILLHIPNHHGQLELNPVQQKILFESLHECKHNISYIHQISLKVKSIVN